MCLALCLALGVKKWKDVAPTPQRLPLWLRQNNQHMLSNHTQRSLVNELVSVRRNVCRLQFVLYGVTNDFLQRWKTFRHISSSQSTRGGQYTDGRIKIRKRSKHTEHWALCNMLLFKNEGGVHVQKDWIGVNSHRIKRMWLGNKVPCRLTAPGCSFWTALSLTWTVAEGEEARATLWGVWGSSHSEDMLETRGEND